MSAQELLSTLKSRYKLLLADIEEGELVTTTAVVGGASFNVHKVLVDGDLAVLAGFDDDDREILIVQHYSQLDLVFSVVPRTQTENKRPGLGFLKFE
jgi:hypothetical protein